MGLFKHIWLYAALLLLMAGIVGSLLGAWAVVRGGERSAKQSEVTTATEISSTLDLAIQHEQDLVVGGRAFVLGNPDATQSEFLQWTSAIGAFERYPELQGIGEVVLVPASQLAAFAARAEADPVGPLAAGGTFQVVPSGNRPYYCFETVSQAGNGQATTPAGLDLCAAGLGPALMTARDSGQGAYVPGGVGRSAELVVGTPIYEGGVLPTTVQARRDALVGWVGTQVLPSVILTEALKGHPHTALAFDYKSGSTHATFKAGTVPSGAQEMTVVLHNGWSVRVFTVAAGTGLSGNPVALSVLLGGILISLSLAILLYVLGTSRSRALDLVRERTDDLRHQAFHDYLTGLPNRALILDRAGQMLARSRRDRTPAAALFIDLDNFKDINDTLGHGAGDQLLVGVGARLESALRGGDTVGRLGGDEFIVLAEGGSLLAGPSVLAERILDVLSIPFEIPGVDEPLEVTASIGIAEGDRVIPEDLLRDADIALYQAKAAGKRCAVVFSPAMRESVNNHRLLEVDLRRALEFNQFFLLYQPTVDLVTGDLIGVEALLRWRHPQRGVVLPEDFVPALESSGLIVHVGQWALETACRQGAAWQNDGSPITVSVNVSAVQLERDQIIDEVRGAVVASRFDPALLILELTESALMHDVRATLRRLTLLKAIGVGIAIDDFGTGYSSLAYLRQFPIDVLKIDQSFVSGMSDSPESAAIVHLLVQLGKVLELKTLAEGIENNDQLLRLKAEHVDIGQGFLFALPLEAGEVDRLLADRAGRASGRSITPYGHGSEPAIGAVVGWVAPPRASSRL
jgi:diguanylate cyclase (GGDEF)-like protein